VCSWQTLAALIAVLAAAAGVIVIDPFPAVLIADIAAKEGAELWRGEECGCHTSPSQPSPPGGCSREHDASA
jgi:hypothetical protein